VTGRFRVGQFGPAAALALSGAAVGGAASWLHTAYLRRRVVRIAPDVYAAFGGGGNSLVVRSGDETLLVDTNFGVSARSLHRWISVDLGARVTAVVNTHYHYDHTHGNVLYPTAEVIAHRRVPELMSERDGCWWDRRPSAMPTTLLGEGSQARSFGRTEAVLTHPGWAHTHGDLVVHLPEHDVVATGDVLFNGFYPYFDTGCGGASIPGLVHVLRRLAGDHPKAVFVPGHGPLSSARDLRRSAEYLEHLLGHVEDARSRGLGPEEAGQELDASPWGLSILPITFEGIRPVWSTSLNNVRWAYQMTERDGKEPAPA